jgi:hypothetical protein
MEELIPPEHRLPIVDPEPYVAFTLHRMGQLELAYRDAAERVLRLLPPDDDRAITVRRVLEHFEH